MTTRPLSKTVNNKSWSGFELALIEKEINENWLFKIVNADEIACTFVITYSDPIIWENSDQDKAIEWANDLSEHYKEGRFSLFETNYNRKFKTVLRSNSKVHNLSFVKKNRQCP